MILSNKLKVALIEDKMKKSQLKWFGHVQRGPTNVSVGRSGRTWIQEVKGNLTYVGE